VKEMIFGTIIIVVGVLVLLFFLLRMIDRGIGTGLSGGEKRSITGLGKETGKDYSGISGAIGVFRGLKKDPTYKKLGGVGQGVEQAEGHLISQVGAETDIERQTSLLTSGLSDFSKRTKEMGKFMQDYDNQIRELASKPLDEKTKQLLRDLTSNVLAVVDAFLQTEMKRSREHLKIIENIGEDVTTILTSQQRANKNNKLLARNLRKARREKASRLALTPLSAKIKSLQAQKAAIAFKLKFTRDSAAAAGMEQQIKQLDDRVKKMEQGLEEVKQAKAILDKDYSDLTQRVNESRSLMAGAASRFGANAQRYLKALKEYRRNYKDMRKQIMSVHSDIQKTLKLINQEGSIELIASLQLESLGNFFFNIEDLTEKTIRLNQDILLDMVHFISTDVLPTNKAIIEQFYQSDADIEELVSAYAILKEMVTLTMDEQQVDLGRLEEERSSMQGAVKLSESLIQSLQMSLNQEQQRYNILEGEIQQNIASLTQSYTEIDETKVRLISDIRNLTQSINQRREQMRVRGEEAIRGAELGLRQARTVR